MLLQTERPILAPQDMTSRALLELGFPVHRIGYKQLCIAIPRYARDDTQSLSKSLYPDVAETLGYADWRSVEHTIRDVIVYAWKHGDRTVWSRYFPGCRKAPTNKRFIATLTELLKS